MIEVLGIEQLVQQVRGSAQLLAPDVTLSGRTQLAQGGGVSRFSSCRQTLRVKYAVAGADPL